MQYRKDIDGLRALAIIPVILHHAGFHFVPGGFLGVDIFFVISGFLITSIICYELEHDKFSITKFYERRSRRILPALTVVLLATVLVSILALPAYLFKEFSQSLLATASFLSNVFFYTEFGYFSPKSDEMPLLHTWSLAVEEQFYIFFPLILMLVWKISRKMIIPVITILFITSLVLSEYWLRTGNDDASFYLVFARGWELLVGSLAAIYMKDRVKINNKLNEAISAVSFIGIFLSLLFWQHSFSHPGIDTLFPVLCTVLLIVFTCKDSLTYRLLSNKIFVFIGTISYSLYLWHQPVFVFFRVNNLDKPSLVLMSLAIVLTGILSFLTYKYVETPFRQKTFLSQKRIFQFSTVSLAIFFSLGLAGHMMNGWPERFEQVVEINSMNPSPKRQQCQAKGLNYMKPADACKYFKDDINWAVLGDSHSIEPAYEMAQYLKHQDKGLLQLSFAGCAPSLHYATRRKGCTEWTNEAVEYLESQKEIKNVLIAYRYSAHLYGDHVKNFPHVSKKLSLKVLNFNQLTDEDKIKIYWDDIEEILSRLTKSGKNVYLVFPIPELPGHIGKITTPVSVFSTTPLSNLSLTTTKTYYDDRNSSVLPQLNRLVDKYKINKVDTYNLLCDGSGCPASIDGKALYYDDDHLSTAGAKILLERYFSHVEL
jgi:peptidoglycan/LPS O-acetylase OafA/YrhL